MKNIFKVVLLAALIVLLFISGKEIYLGNPVMDINFYDTYIVVARTRLGLLWILLLIFSLALAGRFYVAPQKKIFNWLIFLSLSGILVFFAYHYFLLK